MDSSPDTVRAPWWMAAYRTVLDRLAVLAAPERRFELVGLMTLLLLLLFPENIWYLKVGVYGLSILAILHRPLLRSPALWLALTFFLVAGHARSWFYIDNHKFLITYWCLAVGLARLAAEPMQALRHSARYLIGLAFLFAVVAKLLSPDYLSGAFFEGMLLSDVRFARVASFVGGIPLQNIQFSDLARLDLAEIGDPALPLPYPSSGRLSAFAFVLTWWTLFIELAVALAFLWPEDRGLSRWRDAVLLVFMITTYPIAPVIGFAWVLAAMGVAQASTQRSARWTGLYVATYLAVMLLAYVPVARFLPF